MAALGIGFCCVKAKLSAHHDPAVSALANLDSACRHSAIGPEPVRQLFGVAAAIADMFD